MAGRAIIKHGQNRWRQRQRNVPTPPGSTSDAVGVPYTPEPNFPNATPSQDVPLPESPFKPEYKPEPDKTQYQTQPPPPTDVPAGSKLDGGVTTGMGQVPVPPGSKLDGGVTTGMQTIPPEPFAAAEDFNYFVRSLDSFSKRHESGQNMYADTMSLVQRFRDLGKKHGREREVEIILNGWRTRSPGMFEQATGGQAKGSMEFWQSPTGAGGVQPTFIESVSAIASGQISLPVWLQGDPHFKSAFTFLAGVIQRRGYDAYATSLARKLQQRLQEAFNAYNPNVVSRTQSSAG